MTARLRAILVDDEPLAIERLDFLLRRAPGVEVIGSAKTSTSGLELIRTARPDVVFIDVRMPEMDGLQLVERLKDAGAPAVIFVTAHSRFAQAAFDLAAADYLLKPIDFDRLVEAVERARAALEAKAASARILELQRTIAAMQSDPAGVAGPVHEREFWVTSRNLTMRVPADDIRWARAEGDYVRLHTADRSYLIRRTMTDFVADLDPGAFMRVHRSSVVSLRHVTSVERASGARMWVLLDQGERIPVGRNQLADLRVWLEERPGFRR